MGRRLFWGQVGGVLDVYAGAPRATILAYNADPSAEVAAAQAAPSAPLGVASLALPDSCSNKWPRSWKRFMIDFAYGPGANMLHPHVKGSAGLATTLHLAGEHTKGLPTTHASRHW
jgi:hypothetical protein